MRGALFKGPYYKDHTILGYYIRIPIFGNSHKGTIRV